LIILWVPLVGKEKTILWSGIKEVVYSLSTK